MLHGLRWTVRLQEEKESPCLHQGVPRSLLLGTLPSGRHWSVPILPDLASSESWGRSNSSPKVMGMNAFQPLPVLCPKSFYNKCHLINHVLLFLSQACDDDLFMPNIYLKGVSPHCECTRKKWRRERVLPSGVQRDESASERTGSSSLPTPGLTNIPVLGHLER